MKDLILKFRQSALISEKIGYFPEKLKTRRPPTIIEFNISCWNYGTIQYE